MKVLDCESMNSVFKSLETIFGVRRNRLESAFDEIDLDEFYRNNPTYHMPPNEYLFSEVAKKISPATLDFDQICWFHLTRTPQTNTFENGILPLIENLNAIWDFLFTLIAERVSKSEWDDFREHISKVSSHHHADLYRLKTQGSIHWGPFAILVKDIGFRPQEFHNHDYFHAPEIVEDICFVFFDEICKFDLLSAFRQNTKACIVKFLDADPRTDCLRAAIFHAYTFHRGLGCSTYCHTCFDGRGKLITRDQILYVEFREYP